MRKIDYEKLEKYLARLKDQHEFFQANQETLSGNIEEGIKESIIKRFEICYDTLWKHIKKFMEQKERLVDIAGSPKGIFRRAHEISLIDSGMQERLNRYNEIRGDAAHDYSAIKASKALDEITDFIADATEIYQAMVDWE